MKRRRGSVLVVAGLAGALGSLDTTVNVAFPDLIEGLDVTVAAVQWVVLCYVTTYAVVLLPAGVAADKLGHGRVMAVGLGVGIVGFLATGLAPSLPWLLAGRVIQGIGIGLVLATAPALVTRAVEPDRRTRALAGFQTATSIGVVAGPLLGGLLVRNLGGWRSVFLFRIPISALLLAAVVVTGATALVRSDTSKETPDAEPSPLSARSSLLRTEFVLANVLNVVANAAMFGIWLLVPFYVIDILGGGPVAAGVVLALTALATALAARPASMVADRIGLAHTSSIGLAVEAVGLFLLSRSTDTTSLVQVGAALGVVGAGLGLFTVPNMSLVMGSIADDRQGVASGVNQTMRVLGIVVGVVATTAIFDARRTHHGELASAADVVDPSVWVPAFADLFLIASAVAAMAAAAGLVSPGRRSQRGSNRVRS